VIYNIVDNSDADALMPEAYAPRSPSSDHPPDCERNLTNSPAHLGKIGHVSRATARERHRASYELSSTHGSAPRTRPALRLPHHSAPIIVLGSLQAGEFFGGGSE
jgi:hypothetical protein